jgi:hypothetical protein
MDSRHVVFELELVAVDKPTERKRWTGDPMHSEEASAALFMAVDAFQAAIRNEGFDIASTSYGARWLDTSQS